MPSTALNQPGLFQRPEDKREKEMATVQKKGSFHIGVVCYFDKKSDLIASIPLKNEGVGGREG